MSRAPEPPAEPLSGLSERLARRLAASSIAESRTVESSAPQFASLPPAETVPAAAAPGRPAEQGNPALPPGAIMPVGYFPHTWYLAMLKEKVFAPWSPPSELFRSSRPPTALVSFRIDRSGGISGITLKEGSGFARFDKSALAAIQGLGQVAALPEQYREETLDVVIRFQNQK